MMGMGRKLAKHPKIHVDPAKALIETFLAVNEGLNGLNDEATLFSGCTAVVMLIRCGHIMFSSFPLMVLSILRLAALLFAASASSIFLHEP